FTDLAAIEETLGVGDTPHAQAFQRHGLKVLADDEFRRAAADIDNQASARFSQGVSRTKVDQAGFLAASNDLDAGTEQSLGAFYEHLTVIGIAQGVGADHTHARCRNI